MTRKAPSVCATPGCPELTPCPTHVPRQPAGSDRRRTRGIRGSGWDERDRNRRTIRRHQSICHWCGHPDADQVDHLIEITDAGPDTPANKLPIHGDCPHCGRRCHREKTTEAARRRRRPPPGG